MFFYGLPKKAVLERFKKVDKLLGKESTWWDGLQLQGNLQSSPDYIFSFVISLFIAKPYIVILEGYHE